MPRDMDEDSNVFGMEEGCAEHGGERMLECTACGTEFCALCFPRSPVCADCAEEGDLDEDGDEDFDDVGKVGKVLDEEERDGRGKNDDDDSP